MSFDACYHPTRARTEEMWESERRDLVEALAHTELDTPRMGSNRRRAGIRPNYCIVLHQRCSFQKWRSRGTSIWSGSDISVAESYRGTGIGKAVKWRDARCRLTISNAQRRIRAKLQASPHRKCMGIVSFPRLVVITKDFYQTQGVLGGKQSYVAQEPESSSAPTM